MNVQCPTCKQSVAAKHLGWLLFRQWTITWLSVMIVAWVKGVLDPWREDAA